MVNTTAKEFKLVMRLCKDSGYKYEDALFVWGIFCAVNNGLTEEQWENVYGKKNNKTKK